MQGLIYKYGRGQNRQNIADIVTQNLSYNKIVIVSAITH